MKPEPCPLCDNELAQVGGKEGEPATSWICQCRGGITASPEWWEAVRILKAENDKYKMMFVAISVQPLDYKNHPPEETPNEQ